MPRVYDQSSPIARTLEVVGDRWTILILQDLLRGYHRFVELKESLKGVPTNILSGRLRLLESHGIVGRRIYSEHPLRAQYHLTRKGHELGIVAGIKFKYYEPVRSGDKITSEQKLISVSKIMETKLGLGRKWNIDVIYTNQNKDLVGLQSVRMLAYTKDK